MQIILSLIDKHELNFLEKKKLLMLAGEDLYYATLNPSQAALMLYGIAPPTPKESTTENPTSGAIQETYLDVLVGREN